MNRLQLNSLSKELFTLGNHRFQRWQLHGRHLYENSNKQQWPGRTEPMFTTIYSSSQSSYGRTLRDVDSVNTDKRIQTFTVPQKIALNFQEGTQDQ